MLQYVAVCCSMLQCVLECVALFCVCLPQCNAGQVEGCGSMWQYVAVRGVGVWCCCRMYTAGLIREFCVFSCNAGQVEGCGSVLQYVAVCCSVCCSVWQYVLSSPDLGKLI